MLSCVLRKPLCNLGGVNLYAVDGECSEVTEVPVLVWPMPTSEGLFVVEHQDGFVQTVHPESLTFLGSKELFDQYSWEDA